MHPILFRIPLPHMPLKLWWALAAVAAIAVLYAALAVRKSDRASAFVSVVVALAAGTAVALVVGARRHGWTRGDLLVRRVNTGR